MRASALILACLLIAFAPAVNASGNACDFTTAARVRISDYTTEGGSVASADAIYIAEPSSWDYPTFWRGYESASPFGDFYDLPMVYLAVFKRGRQTVGMIEVRMDSRRALILMLDERGRVPDSSVWHGCAALIVGLTGDIEPLAWFTRGIIDG